MPRDLSLRERKDDINYCYCAVNACSLRQEYIILPEANKPNLVNFPKISWVRMRMSRQCQCGYRTNKQVDNIIFNLYYGRLRHLVISCLINCVHLLREVAAAQVIMQRGLSSVAQTQIMLVEGKVSGGLIHG